METATQEAIRRLSSGKPYNEMSIDELHAWMSFYITRERLQERGSEAHAKIINQQRHIAEYVTRKELVRK